MEQILILNPMSVEARNESIEHTVHKERKKLLNYIRKKVPSDEDAEDILQDVFYQFTSTMQFDFIDRAAAWLFKAANNKIIDWYRKSRPVTFNKLILGNTNNAPDDNVPIQLADILFDPTENPDTLYLRSMLWPMLTEILDELPEEQREVFVMHELEDVSFRELAEMTGTPVNTLISRKRYAVLYLRERLQGLYDEFFKE
jgi:RNA polymerase sigma factor (sigma-70 family)